MTDRQIRRIVRTEFTIFQGHRRHYIDGEVVVNCPRTDRCAGEDSLTLRWYEHDLDRGGGIYNISDDWRSTLECPECGVLYRLTSAQGDEIQHRLEAYAKKQQPIEKP